MIDSNTLKNIRSTMNIDSPISHNLTKLNRYKIRMPSHEIDNTIPHIFITKPDCYMFAKESNGSVLNSNIGSRPEFNALLKSHPELFRTLQENQGNPGPFINQLSNAAQSYDVQDTIIKTRESAETLNDWKVIYGHRANDSRSANTLNIDFIDDRKLNVYHTIEIWVNYIDLITRGFIGPHQDNRLNNILDYACSIYYFLTAEDGKTIIYYSKLVGVFPTNIPESVFSASSGLNTSKLEYSVQFQYSMKSTSPLVLKDFKNITNSKDNDGDSGTYINGIGGPTWHTNVKLVEKPGGIFQLIYQRG